MDYLFFVLTVICVWIILSLAANLVLGYAGMMTIGHVAYLAIGAYTSAILNVLFGVNYFLTLPAAVVVTALFALATVYPLLRLNTFYFGLATLGLNVVVADLIQNAAPKSPGAEGLLGVQVPPFMLTGAGRFGIAVLLTAIAVAVTWRIVSSPFGRTLRALRDDSSALESLGKDANAYRLIVWTTSGALAGLAGGLYTATLDYIDATVFAVFFSFNLLVYIGVGGLASIAGSVLGPTLLIGFSELLRFSGLPSQISGPAQQAIFALLLIAVMLYRRQGLLGRYDFRE